MMIGIGWFISAGARIKVLQWIPDVRRQGGPWLRHPRLAVPGQPATIDAAANNASYAAIIPR